MPLVVLGLIVFLGIVIYALVIYGNSDDTDDRPVRVKYPHVFNKHKDDKPFDYEFEDDYEDDDGGGGDGSDGTGGSGRRSGSSGDGHTMYFPDDAEIEKRKRNIH